jgi:hypothetical protein
MGITYIKEFIFALGTLAVYDNPLSKEFLQLLVKEIDQTGDSVKKTKIN